MKKQAVNLTAEQIKKIDSLETVADKIRYLNSLANFKSNGDISRTLSSHLKRFIRPQWVNNVLTNDRESKKYA